MMVRNEEDILEASIRHNLAAVDSLLVLDHGSDDATPEILAALAREGLPIELQRDDTLALRRPEVERLFVERLLGSGADICIPLDADEFLRIPARAPFEEIVRRTDPAQPLALPVRTYVPAFDLPGDLVHRLRHASTVSNAPAAPAKVVMRRPAADTPGLAAGMPPAGARSGDRGMHFMPATVLANVAMIARVPIRSAAQFTAKIAAGYLFRVLDGDNAAGRFGWQDEYEALLAGRAFTPDRLRAIAAAYGLPAGHGFDPQKAAWIEDPFLGDMALVHTPSGEPNALTRILMFGERVAIEIARATGGL